MTAKDVRSYICFQKMNSGIIPIFFIDPVIVSVKIQLIHSEYYQKILRLPLFFV